MQHNITCLSSLFNTLSIRYNTWYRNQALCHSQLVTCTPFLHEAYSPTRESAWTTAWTLRQMAALSLSLSPCRSLSRRWSTTMPVSLGELSLLSCSSSKTMDAKFWTSSEIRAFRRNQNRVARTAPIPTNTAVRCGKCPINTSLAMHGRDSRTLLVEYRSPLIVRLKLPSGVNMMSTAFQKALSILSSGYLPVSRNRA